MIRFFAVLAFATFASMTVACGGTGEVGESCDTPGATDDECAEGAVCDDTETGETLCLQTCEDQEDCAADEACNGVTGSDIKACHPKEEGEDGSGEGGSKGK